MKIIRVIVFVLFSRACGFISEEKISKVVCSFSRLENANIYTRSLAEPFKLAKQLFKECNIKIKFVSNIKDFDDNDLISFAFEKQNNKETL